MGLSLCFVSSLDMLLSLAVWDTVAGSQHSGNVDVGERGSFGLEFCASWVWCFAVELSGAAVSV